MKANVDRQAATHHLSKAELDLLLALDDGSEPIDGAAEHLEVCDVCRSRLASLAAESHEWSDAESFLSGDSEPRWEPDTSQVAIGGADAHPDRALAQDLVLKLLGTPQHPEMLGRLGRYDIERVIGSGGMGIVLKAHDSELNRPIAIKMLAPHLAHVGAARERFAREGRAAAAVVHEHVVAIYGVESGGPVPFLVMQYVPGRSLQARVDEDGPLGVEEILRIGVQAASGLAAAHRQGLVHRDVKPSNILLENSVERAVLTDFGLARAIDDASLTQTGILAGTPHYMSPEQATGGPIDHRSDLFSLGAVLYFMATGHPPFRGASALGVLHRICSEVHRPAWQRNKSIPDELSDVIDRLLAKKPARRWTSAEEVQQQLAHILSRVQQFGVGRRRFRGWRGKRLLRKLAWGAAAAGLCGTIAAAVMWQSISVPPEPAAVDFTQFWDHAMELKQLDEDFFSDLGAATGELQSTTPHPRFLQLGEDAWSRELNSIDHELHKLESLNGKLPE
jgi:eukaryotic-like serine/threonine-protein kinase